MLEVFSIRLNGALGNLVECKLCLPVAGEVGWLTPNSPLQPKTFYNSVII